MRAREWREKNRGGVPRERRAEGAAGMVISNSQVAIGEGAQVNVCREPLTRRVKGRKAKAKVKAKGKGKGKRTRGHVSDSDAGEPQQGSWSPSSFVQMYNKMEEQYMWRLPSGAFVETILYEKIKTADRECLAHSFVLDVKNKKVEALFEPSDWRAILERVPEWPVVGGEAVEFMKGFMSVRTAAGLRERLAEAKYLPEGEKYDREEHYDCYWIHMVITMLYVYNSPRTDTAVCGE